MHVSLLALAVLAFCNAASAVEISMTITTGGSIAPVVFTSVTGDAGDHHPFGYFVDGCKVRDNIREVCIDSSRRRAHVIWTNGVRQCLNLTRRDQVQDGRNHYEYITYTGVGCSW
ncbi:hypothetical protein Micbo1qcDRAFT_209559 [Microdochium bolleyi]|uniref:Uncharacterized protein n=1 Tax=Microdochium bolleyi TaxID=196109 RepID=A0A136ILJ3_9PEZI|nr:hypothetical protein Micbo1qcDRAFT_209559 [Microdochium bolleyi]